MPQLEEQDDSARLILALIHIAGIQRDVPALDILNRIRLALKLRSEILRTHCGRQPGWDLTETSSR